MKKFIFIIIGLLSILWADVSYAETPSLSGFEAVNDLTSRYRSRQVLDGKTTLRKKKNNETYLEFPYEESPYMYFSSFVVNSPTTVYDGFIETIYYRDNIKIKEMYYEKNPVKTSALGIYSTDLYFTSEDGEVYHYKNVPYLVTSDTPTLFFREINYDEEAQKIVGKIDVPRLEDTYHIELYYTDNDEYHYQEAIVDKNGQFNMELSREGKVGQMYLRANDGLGNYADPCDISEQGKMTFAGAPKKVPKKSSKKKVEPTNHFFSTVILRSIQLFAILFLTFLGLKIRKKRKKKQQPKMNGTRRR
ncbi:hypothetical protein [Enterococcus termitis]|uniref:Uncharacterized protein n=1 Tax=Enterococcus termitis TaxID=332950 RepID=A0A1E5H659_9ENTE|nr:hypothetical protein [Enterococcus termitis]OEG20325.1 hypothetical protein BCR25_00420 [Enterococcus termitis]OJG97249.1 hypothetical protein RV18_GL000937 [Enterococcus termitis]